MKAVILTGGTDASETKKLVRHSIRPEGKAAYSALEVLKDHVEAAVRMGRPAKKFSCWSRRKHCWNM